MAKDKKDSYWFKHDLHPLSDAKIISMIGEFGAAGYGLYWKIVEILHSENSHKLSLDRMNIYSIAKQMRSDDEQMQANAEQMLTNAEQNILNKFNSKLTTSDVEFFIKRCITTHKLFISDESYFWSDRVNKNISEKSEISEIRRQAAISKQSK